MYFECKELNISNQEKLIPSEVNKNPKIIVLVEKMTIKQNVKANINHQIITVLDRMIKYETSVSNGCL